MQADETRFQRSGLPVQPNLGRCGSPTRQPPRPLPPPRRLELNDAVGVPAGSIAPWALRLAHPPTPTTPSASSNAGIERRRWRPGRFNRTSASISPVSARLPPRKGVFSQVTRNRKLCRGLHLERQRRMSIPALGNAQGSPGIENQSAESAFHHLHATPLCLGLNAGG